MERYRPPKKLIDWESLEGYLELNASLDFCATKQLERLREEVNYKSIRAMRNLILTHIKKRHGMLFHEYRTKKLESVALTVFQKQIDVMKTGNVTMLIWLGKQLLGQSDKMTDPNLGKPQYVVIDKIQGGKVIGETQLQTVSKEL